MTGREKARYIPQISLSAWLDRDIPHPIADTVGCHQVRLGRHAIDGSARVVCEDCQKPCSCWAKTVDAVETIAQQVGETQMFLVLGALQ